MWSRNFPTESGFYFIREGKSDEADICEFDSENPDFLFFIGEGEPLHLSDVEQPAYFQPVRMPLP